MVLVAKKTPRGFGNKGCSYLQFWNLFRKVWSIVNQWLMKPYHVCVKRKIRDRITLKTNQLEVYFQIHFHFFLLKLWHILKSTLTFEIFQAHLFKTFDGHSLSFCFFFSLLFYMLSVPTLHPFTSGMCLQKELPTEFASS